MHQTDAASSRARWLVDQSIADGPLAGRWFARLWTFSLTLLVIGPGRNFGLGNTNPFERSILLAAMLLFVWKRPVRSWSLVGLSLMGLAIVVSGAFTSYPDFAWSRMAMASVALFTMLGFMTVEGREQDVLLIMRSITLLPICMVAFSFLMYLLFNWPLMQRDHTGASRLGGAVLPAFLAASCYAAVVAAGYLFCLQQRALDLYLVVAALVISILSGSRMATACAGLSMLPFLFASRKSGVSKTVLVLYGSAGIACFLLTFGDQLIQRFISGSTSGREQMWNVLQAVANRYPLFGIGFGHHGLIIPESVSRFTGTVAAHNELLRLRVEIGTIGSTIFATGWLLYWLRFWSKYIVPTITFVLQVAIFVVFSTTDNTLFLTNTLLTLVAIGMGAPLLTKTYTKKPKPRSAGPSQTDKK